jgi:hypothetical protein
MKSLRKGISSVALTLCLYSNLGTAGQDDRSPIKAVINYSAAPWDDAAYEIIVPIKKIPASSNPVIRIDIWGNPEFQEAKSFRFSKEGSQKEGGRASFQPVLNQSLPMELTGTVSFKALKKGYPVFDALEFVSSDGRMFNGSFKANWGNKQLPYIR